MGKKNRRKGESPKPGAQQRQKPPANKSVTLKNGPHYPSKTSEQVSQVAGRGDCNSQITGPQHNKALVTLIGKASECFSVIFGMLFGYSYISQHPLVSLWLLFVGICLCLCGLFCFTHVWIVETKIDPPPAAVSATASAPNVSERALAHLIDQTPQRTGLIVPGNGRTPSMPPHFDSREDPVPNDALLLFLGESVAWNSSFPHVVIRQRDHEKQRDEDMLVINRSEAGIGIRAKMFDKEGRPICEIIDNRFHSYLDNQFRLDRPNPRELIVTDKNAREVLSVEYVNESAVRILGDFFIRRGKRILITPKLQEPGIGRHTNSVFGENAIDFYVQ